MWTPLQQVRPGERREVAAAFCTLFAIMTGHALLETARDALFLASLPPQRLPWVYLGIAAAAFLLTLLQRGGLGRVGGPRGLALWLAGAGLVTLFLWHLVAASRPWTLFALYGWTGVFATLVLIRFWTLAGDLFTVTQAKRLFPLVGAGSVAGAIAGSAVARLLAAEVGGEGVLLAGAVALLVSGGVPLLLPRQSVRYGTSSSAGISLSGWRSDLDQIGRRPYLRRVALLILSSTVFLTVVDYLFKSTVAARVPAADLGSFFATVYLGLNLGSLAVQVLVVGLLLKVLGVNRAMLVLPALVLLGAAGLALGGGILAALVLKGADGTLRHSLHRTAVETLYLPLPGDLRTRLKGFMDAGGQRGGQALASLLILAVVSLGGHDEILAVAVILLCILFGLLVLELRGHYLDLFRATLSEHEIQHGVGVPPLDVASLETLMATLNSADDAEVLATLDLLAEQDRVRLIPALILYHPSRAVVLRALELFGKWGRRDFVAMVPRLLEHPDPAIRAAALRASGAVESDPAMLLREFLDDEDETVRATALVGLVHSGWLEEEEGRRALEKLERDASDEEKTALARAVWHQPGEVFAPLLLRLARSGSVEVRYEVARAMDEVGHPDFLDALVGMLADRRLRAVARSALVRMGEPALERLDAVLGDPATPLPVRRHLPRTISRFGGEEAAAILLDHLLEEGDGLTRYKILRGLNRLRADEPRLRLDPRVLVRATEETLAGVGRLLRWRVDLERGGRRDPERATPTHGLLVELLADKEERARERLFRLLGLQYSVGDMHSIYRGLRSRSGKVRSGSRELLEHLLKAPVRDAVLSLVDEVPAAQRLEGLRAPAGADYVTTLGRLLDSGSESLACLAAYHAGELGLVDLDPRLARLEEQGSPLLRGVVERARALLRAPRGEGMRYG